MAEPSCMPCRGDGVSADEPGRCFWVASAADLAEAAGRWAGVIGIDTEFQRTDTFFPIPGLYQVAAGSGTWLVDPLAVDDWAPFVDVLTNPDTVKVMHACSEDLELFYRHLNVRPHNIFDTQLAAAFVSEDFSTGYASLIEATLGVALPKHHTRSNWLRRPLSDEQLLYAREDVAYLVEVRSVLKSRLEEAGRWHWFIEDMQRSGRYSAREPASYFTGVKKAWKLDGGQLAVLKCLCEWRERRAMSEDVPRNRVVWDEHLLDFAQRPSVDLAEVWRKLPPRVARRYGEELARAHREGLGAPPEARLPKPLSQRQGGVLKRLREIGRRRAQELGIAPELLARGRNLEECIRRYRATGCLSETYLGWRNEVLGSEFLAELERRA